VRRGRAQRRATQHRTEGTTELLSPPARTGRIAVDPSLGRVARDDEVGSNESTVWRGQASKYCDRDAEGRIGDDVEWPFRKAKVGDVGLDDGHAITRESLPEFFGPFRMEFESNDLRATLNQGSSNRSGSGPDIENEVTAPDAGLVDQASGPLFRELVPSPARLRRGHGGPS